MSRQTLQEAKAPVYSLDGAVKHDVKLPEVFLTAVRPDIIKRAVLSVQSKGFQPKGRDPMAGKRTTAWSLGVGLGMARIPRVRAHGTPRAMQGAFAPGTVGGRLAHPPTPEKNIVKQINRKERRLAIRSAIAATALPELVAARGHKIEGVKSLPLIVEGGFEQISTTKQLKEILKTLGLEEELKRAEEGVKIRSGKGRRRGRRLKRRKSLLIVVGSEVSPVMKAARNLPGVDVCPVNRLNAELLAPGTHPGRLTLWTEPAIKGLEERFRHGEA
ncbi:MAG: 50S ribosomal protein L4 [Candidatus Hecatellales archaeon B24]|nr:MAG: 50S ribosomal protein L4 [Candidatus Hecatellales archaeon B24]